MATPFSFSLSARARLIEAKQIICDDWNHFHRSPIQNMISMEINGRFVEVTQDGDNLHARIDEQLTAHNLTPEQLDQFIKDNT